jgi:hypothetical protein
MFDGFNKAIVGFCSTWHGDIQVGRVVYDGEQVMTILSGLRKDLSEDEIADYIEDNFIDNYHGPGSPIIVWKAPLSEIQEYLDENQ